MTQDDNSPTLPQRRGRIRTVARLMGAGAMRSLSSYVRRLLVFFASWPMAFFVFAPPDSPLDYHPDASTWACRIIIGVLVVAVNFGVLLPELTSRARPVAGRIYLGAVTVILIGTPLAYIMRLIFIDRH